MRKVLIATPSHDGKLEASYVNSLLQSIKLCNQLEIELIPLWMCYDSLVQRCRNDLIAIAIEHKFDDILWIDSDIEWNPEWIIKLLQSNKDVIGGTYRKKTDEQEIYLVKTDNKKIDKEGLLEVDGLGFGFLKMSKKAFTTLWKKSKSYETDGIKSKMIFNIDIEKGKFIGEDIVVCNKLKKLGFIIYLDPSMTCNHIGAKKYVGNFNNWINKE